MVVRWNVYSLCCGRVGQRGMTRSPWKGRWIGRPARLSWKPCSISDLLHSWDLWRVSILNLGALNGPPQDYQLLTQSEKLQSGTRDALLILRASSASEIVEGTVFY
jgi:hypothetical protein